MSISSIQSAYKGFPMEARPPAEPPQARPPGEPLQASPPGEPLQARRGGEAQSEPAAGAARSNDAQKPKPAVEKKTAPSSSPDVTLRYRMDEETKEMVLYLVDRKSKEVLRTIPADAQRKMSPGELVSLTA